MTITCFVYKPEAWEILKSQGIQPEELCLSTEREVFKVLGEPMCRINMEKVQETLNRPQHGGGELHIFTWG